MRAIQKATTTSEWTIPNKRASNTTTLWPSTTYWQAAGHHHKHHSTIPYNQRRT
jgi:hypothetical protein